MIISDEMLQKHIEILRNAKLEGSLAVFVGSGLSCATDKTKYKSWSELVDELKQALSCKEEQDFLKIAQLYSLEFGRIQTKKKVRSNFPHIDVPGELQEAVISLRPHYIVTTNWDNLLDNAIDDAPGSIDKIATDKELVQSDKDKKYIKMHGDFVHDNYVFTEDDYLNYAYNFPLIENFVKTILFTHTILLIGYSFSDWDLKQIISWIRHNSDERPPIYMFEKKDFSPVTAKYYDNLGIDILPLYKDGFSDYDLQLKNLLSQITGDKPTNVISSPENYVLSVLKPLNDYPLILSDNIVHALTNSRIIYDFNNRAILQFYVEIETKDKDDSIRETYKRFYESIEKYNDEDNASYQQIASILQKADIHGISTDSDIWKKKRYYGFDKENSIIYDYSTKSINFDFSLSQINNLWDELLCVYNLFYTEKYQEAFEKVKNIIKLSRRENNYAVMLISMFNYNSILNKLKYSFSLPIEVSKTYRQIDYIDLEIEYENLPQKAKPHVRSVFDFLNFSFIYSNNYKAVKELDEIKKRKNIIAEGGISFTSEVYGSRARLKNIIEFIFNNAICIEDYQEFRELCKTYLQITFENTLESDITVGKIELYTSIKCFSHKSIKEFYSAFYDSELENKRLITSPEITNWLIDIVLMNNIDSFIRNKQVFSSFGEYCDNTLFIISLLHLDKIQTEKILKSLVRLVAEANNSISIFESINSFIGIQYNVFSNKNLDSKLILSILEKLLLKFVQGEINAHEERALAQAKLSNIFGLTSVTETFFTNKKLLQQLLLKIKNLDIREQLNLFQWLLIPLYQMADDTCKKMILEYFKDSDIEKAKDNSDYDLIINYIIIKLLFVCLKIEDSKQELKDLIKTTLAGYPKNRFALIFYTLQEMVDKVVKVDGSYNEIKVFVDSFVLEKSKILPFKPSENK